MQQKLPTQTTQEKKRKFFLLPTNMTSKSNQNFDEHKWVIHICRTLEEEIEEDDQNDVLPSIFNVPKTLMSSDPDSYTPQQVAIGPYHYLRPELNEMERYKLASAKSTQKQLQQCLKFQNVVNQLVRLVPRIHACYHKYLDFNDETLAWMMAIDASFLLEFLQIYVVREGKNLTRVSSRMSKHFVDSAGRKSSHNVILRDIMMLENQIPLFVLKKVLEFSSSSLDLADDVLLAMLAGLCKELSPFKMIENLSGIQVSNPSHLLDFLYHMIIPKSEHFIARETIEADNCNGDINMQEKVEECESGDDTSFLKQLRTRAWKLLLSMLNKVRTCLIKRILSSKLVRDIEKLPWTIISNLPGIRVKKQPLEYIFLSKDKEVIKPEENEGSNKNIKNKPPLVEEITIPSVTELVESGLRFSPTKGSSISTISFDTKTATLYLPKVSLDVNTKVILRNLVAYETSIASGPLVFTRYTELMNRIIDTEEDARLLRKKGVIVNRLKSDEEVVEMWNGMSKSIRLTKVDYLDKVIEDVNKYYNGRWNVKAQKFMKLYIFGSGQFLTFLGAIMLLMFMALQTFSSVYSLYYNFLGSFDEGGFFSG